MSFNKKDVENLSAALSEPGWVLEARLSAWGVFESMELPKEKEEPWRYTDLRRLRFKLDDFSHLLPAAKDQPSGDATEFEGDRSGYVVQRDANTVRIELDPQLQKQGVVLTDLQTAINEHGDLVKEHLFKQLEPESHIFAALHAAMFAGGAFLYVPRGVTIPKPIENQVWIDQDGAVVMPHTLVIVEDDAEVVFFETFRSTNSGPSLSNPALELTAGRASRVTLASLQEFGDKVWHFQNHRTSTGTDCSFKSLVTVFGGRFSRQEIEAKIAGERSTTDLMGIYFAEGNQHVDFRTLQDHAAPQSTSNLLYKGALKDTSKVVYSGLIRVRENAALTDAYQTNRNLVLSDGAMAQSKPELEIENNDVKCSHGASVGQINEEELFYLQARGLPRAEAQRLIVHGFFEEVINRVPNPEIQRVLLDAIARRLDGLAHA